MTDLAFARNFKSMRQLTRRLLIFTLPLLFFCSHIQAASISIIIDDIGYSYTQGLNAVSLPDAVTLSILPDAPYAKELGEKAFIVGHETMLHIPMQAINHAPHEYQTLTTQMSKTELQTAVDHYIKAFPYARGVNNHMGSLLTTRSNHMDWLMEVISAQPKLPMFFVDSRTTTETQALIKAQEHSIPSTRRDVFLDNSENPADIYAQLESLKQKARNEGFALGIAHPHPTTLKILQQELPKLANEGIDLLPVSKYIWKIDQLKSQLVMSEKN